MEVLCPCCSGERYTHCCKILHDGGYAKDARELMRSRYSAYALHLPKYIIRTTHPNNPNYQDNLLAWEQEIMEYCSRTEFHQLEILEFDNSLPESHVTFIAHLEQEHLNRKMTEKSSFQMVGPQWLYRDAEYVNFE